MRCFSRFKVSFLGNTCACSSTSVDDFICNSVSVSRTRIQQLKLMLRSQIKLTSYDFSDLHITGEFDNRPSTGRFLRIFFCVVTYRTGAGRRLYMKTSADARPGTVRRRTVPGRRCKRSTGHRTVPGRFYTNFHVQWWIYVYQNSPSYLQRNNLLK